MLKGAAASKKQIGNSSAMPTPTENEERSCSIMNLPWGNKLGPTSGASTSSPSPANLTQNDSSTSIYTTNAPQVTPLYKFHEEWIDVVYEPIQGEYSS